MEGRAGMKQGRMYFVIQKAQCRGQYGGRLRGAHLEPPGDQKDGKSGWWLRDGEKGITAERFKRRKDQTLRLMVCGW